jgi:hypothetical protein
MTARPQPVVNTETFKSSIQTVAYVLTFFGANDAAGWLDAKTSVLVAVGIAAVNFGGDLAAALHAAGKVTPKDRPQADDGTPLVRVDQTIVSAVPGPSGAVDVEPMED